MILKSLLMMKVQEIFFMVIPTVFIISGKEENIKEEEFLQLM